MTEQEKRLFGGVVLQGVKVTLVWDWEVTRQPLYMAGSSMKRGRHFVRAFANFKCFQACQFETPQLRRGRRVGSTGCLRFSLDPTFGGSGQNLKASAMSDFDSFLRRLIYSKL